MRKPQELPNKEQVVNLALGISEDHLVTARDVAALYIKAKKAIEGLTPHDVLRHMKDKGAWEMFTALKPFKDFPTKKVRFNVFPQSEEKLEYLKQYKEPGSQTMKDSIDTILHLLLTRLPEEYWEHKSEVIALLSPHLPSPGGERPLSLSMNSLGYALLQDLAELLGVSQGAVLEGAAALWLIQHNDLVAKRQEALNILNEFWSQAAEIQDRLKGIFDDPEEPVRNGFSMMMVHLENLHGALDDYVTEGKARWREWIIDGNYE